jgi:hypothetical protein
MPTVTIPRTVSEYPMCFDFPSGAEVPVRMRDDLDQYSPPMEYAGGRISWSGYPSREARDAGREASEVAARRADAVRARQLIIRDIADLERARQTLQQSVARCADHAPLHTSEARGYRYGVTDGRTGSAHNRSEAAARATSRQPRSCQAADRRRDQRQRDGRCAMTWLAVELLAVTLASIITGLAAGRVALWYMDRNIVAKEGAR